LALAERGAFVVDALVLVAALGTDVPAFFFALLGMP
jgi:hypothetical protein